MISNKQIQSNIDGFLEPFRKEFHHIVLEDVKLYLSNPNIRRFNADILNQLHPRVGCNSGTVIRDLIKLGIIKRDGQIKSQRKECHHREIPDYEVIHADRSHD